MRTSVACRRPGCAPRPRLGPAPAHAGSAWFGWASSGCATCSRGGGSGVASGSPPSPGRSRRPGSRSPSTARKHEPCRIPTLVRDEGEADQALTADDANLLDVAVLQGGEHRDHAGLDEVGGPDRLAGLVEDLSE